MTRKAMSEALKASAKPVKPLVAFRLPQDILDAMAAIQKSTGATATAVAIELLRAGLKEWNRR